MPVVSDVLAGMGIGCRAVLMLRNPADIAGSVAARDGTTAAYAHLLWLRHMMDAERATRGMARAILSYETMLDDWRGAVAALGPVTGRPGWTPDRATAAEIAAFLDPALRHHRAVAPAWLEEPLEGIVTAVAAGLAALATRDDDAARGALDRAYGLFDAAPWLEGDIVHDELRHRRMSPEESLGIAAVPRADPEADMALIRASGLFDADWYLDRYPDVVAARMDPVEHYYRYGATEGRNPNALFDTSYYARQMARRMAAEAPVSR